MIVTASLIVLFSGISPELVEWESRFPRVMAEILSYRPQVVCLQEVQADHYESHFLPEMQKAGYAGVYKKRTHEKEDGCAIFYQPEKVL